MRIVFVVGALLMMSSWSGAQEGASKPITLVDASGKEMAFKQWKFVTGTRRLSWLEKEPPAKEKKGMPYGPECLEFRVAKVPMFKEDVTTYIPLTSLKRIAYEGKDVEVEVVGPGGKNFILKGSAEFVGINRFNLDGELDAGTLSVGGPIKLQDGFLKAGIRRIQFPDAAPLAETSGANATVVVRGKDSAKHTVADLQPLYKVGTTYRLIPALQFQKTINVDFKDIVRMTHLPPKGKKGGFLDFEVEKKDGTKQGMTLLDKASFAEKETAVLVGLVGRVPVGYRLFPATVIAEMKRE